MNRFPKFKAEELNGDIQRIDPGSDPDLREAEREAHIKDIRVRSRVKNTILVTFAAIGASIVFTYVWHLVSPCKWRWLTASEVTAIKDLALSIATGVALSLATKFTIK